MGGLRPLIFNCQKEIVMFLDWLWLIVGMILLIKGADFFVDGASKIAKALRIPSLIIGLTLVSMGTSAPEASVSINAAINDMNDLSIGNVVGSNIFNTLFILGVSAFFIPLVVSKEMEKYDIPIMVGVYLVLILFGFVITPYTLNLIESIILLLLFAGYIGFLIYRAKKSPNENAEEEDKEDPRSKKTIIKSIIFAVLGLAAIIFGGDLVVDSASNIAINLGMSEALVGLTIVAVGTSLPELVTSVVASIKKEADIAVGNVIGSNIFNVIFILGFSSTISPLVVNSAVFIDMIVMLASGIIIMVFTLFSNKINKWQGALLVLLYAAYLTYIIIRN